MASSSQPRNRLGKRRSKDDTVPTHMWKKKTEKDENKEVLRKLVPKKFWK